MIVCGQMKRTFAPNLGRHAAHLGGTVLRLLDESIHLPQGSKLFAFQTLSVLPHFKPVNASKTGGLKEISKKWSAAVLSQGRELSRSRAVVSDIWNFSKIRDNVLSSGNYLSGIQQASLEQFSNLRAKLSS